jgi:4-aminobutyrate aminotransferase-like enzyme
MGPQSTIAPADRQRLLAGHDEFLFPCARPYYRSPLVLEEAQGVWVKDMEGREYLDLFAGILTTSIGHCHPAVTNAVTRQMAQIGHTSTLYVTRNQIDVASRIADLAPGALTRSFFTNSGTEAVETAVTLACIFTGRTEVIALKLGYHGRSMLATNLTAHAPWRPLPSSVAGIKHAMSPYPYRCPFRTPCDETCVDLFARDLEEVIETTTNGRPAALIAETIQGVGGFVVPPLGYFERVAEIIRGVGGLLIIDEVQAGWGRTGEHWFGIEHWGVEPDIMVTAKGVANGFPVGVTTTRSDVAESWTPKTISTFGGNPISMAAAAATLEVMTQEDTPARSAARGEQLGAALQGLAARHDWIGEARGMGLMWGLEIVDDRESKSPAPARALGLLEAAKEEGLLIGTGGLQGHVIRIGPSMLIEEDELDEGLTRLARACALVENRGAR